MANNLLLYAMPESGPCRTVMWTAKLLGIELDLKPINLFKREHLKPEFLKLNPQHKIPLLIDGDLILTESRAIILYLVEKYGKNNFLYPKDLKTRALIKQRLYFDLITLAEPISNYYRAIVFDKRYDSTIMSDIGKAIKLLNTFLEKNNFAAGESLTLADIALASTVAIVVIMYDFDLKSYPNVLKWFDNIKTTTLGYKTIIEENLLKRKTAIAKIGAKIKAKF